MEGSDAIVVPTAILVVDEPKEETSSERWKFLRRAFPAVVLVIVGVVLVARHARRDKAYPIVVSATPTTFPSYGPSSLRKPSTEPSITPPSLIFDDLPQLKQAVQQYMDDPGSFDVPIERWDVSRVTSFSHLFDGVPFHALRFLNDIGDWDVSNAEAMDFMLPNWNNYNSDLSRWNTSKVTTMAFMFHLSGADWNMDDLNHWDVSNVQDFEGMFEGNHDFSGNLSNWNTRSATNMQHMFQLVREFSADLSGWNTGKVTSMRGMFKDSRFNGNIATWDTSSVLDMDRMFLRNEEFNGNISAWDVSRVSNMRSMFRMATSFNQVVSTWNVGSAKSFQQMFLKASAFNQDLSA